MGGYQSAKPAATQSTANAASTSAAPKSSGAAHPRANLDPATATPVAKTTQSYMFGGHDVGDEGVAMGGQGECSRSKAAGCFLTPIQRTDLNSQTRERIGSVHGTYNTAVNQLAVEQMIKRVDELPWYMSLLLGACSTVLEGMVSMGVAALKKSGAAATAINTIDRDVASSTGGLKEAVDAANAEGAQLAHAAAVTAANEGRSQVVKDAELEMKTLTAVQVSSMIRSSVMLGKANAIQSFTAASSDQSAQANSKRQGMNYTNILIDKANVMFEQINQDLSTVSDAAALAIWRSLDPTIPMNTIETFKEVLGASLDRFLASDISKIGREMGFEGDKRVEKEVRIAKLIVPGVGMKYVYMDRVFDGWYRDVNMRHPGTAERSGAYDDPQNAFSLDQEADWKIDGKEKRGSEVPLRPDRVLNYVEPEFEEIAKQKQKQVWLNEPEVFQMTYANGYPQVVKVAGS